MDGGSDHPGPLPRPRRVEPGWLIAVGVLVGLGAVLVLHALPRHGPAARGTFTAPPLPASGTKPAVAAGPVPHPLLIADEGDKRLVEITPQKQVMWQYDGAVSSAAFSAHGKRLALTDEDGNTVSVLDYAQKQAVWTLGKGLDVPYGAHWLSGGGIVVPDVRHCRVLTLTATPAPAITAVWGAAQQGFCQTDLSSDDLSYPNGAVPQPNGDVLVTISGSGTLVMYGPHGKIVWELTIPPLFGGIASAAEITPSGHVLVAAMGTPGTVMSFDPKTRTIYWTYHVTSGPGALADPRQAILLSNGDVAVADSGNNRVVVIDPKTSKIVWEYGGPGLLDHPTSVAEDLWHPAPATG